MNQKIILIGVNYNSSSCIGDYLNAWSKIQDVEKIYIVDNFSSEKERQHLSTLCNISKVELLLRPNIGYGAALNYALGEALKNDQHKGALFLFGNVDILPLQINLTNFPAEKVPEISILQGNFNRNPFLKNWHKFFIPITCLAARYKSRALFGIWLVVQKLLQFFPGKTHSVHGALFALFYDQAKILMPIFDDRVFLYCEELFFSKKIRKAGLEFRKTNIVVAHSGSVSTKIEFTGNKRKFFNTWCESMRIYCEK